MARVGVLMALFLVCASAQHHYLVNAPSGNIKDICSRHGLQYVTALSGSAQGLYIVNSPLDLASVQQALRSESSVKNVEEDLPLALPEASKSSSCRAVSPQDVAMVTSGFSSNGWGHADDGAGNSAWNGYLNQPAASTIKAWQAHRFTTGAGTVAILDTGIDYTHPVLRNSLVWGYDFVNNIPMGQAMTMDLSQSTTSILDQSTTSILDQSTTSILDSNSTLVLDQSTTSILDQSTTSILDGTKPINDWGHGTMVAGLIHLVAPSAKLMSVKVFDVHGGSTLSLIIQGIHYAVDSGAHVINMSFSMTGSSLELQNAIAFANNRGVILVAAAGNEGKPITVYPAGYPNVIGVGATDANNNRASFSNYGPEVDLAAPGAGVITTYPGNRYAAGWGTSFSAPMVAGAGALLVQLQRSINGTAALQAVDRARPLNGQQLGAGLLDLLMACGSLH